MSFEKFGKFLLMEPFSINSPIQQVPGIGRRTAQVLFRLGITTVGDFVRMPDLLLSNTFGPSLPRLRRKVQKLLEAPALPFSLSPSTRRALRVLAGFLFFGRPV